MTNTQTLAGAAPLTGHRTWSGRPDAARGALARSVLMHALALGVEADLLLRQGLVGLGFPLWVALVALSAFSLANQSDRVLPRESAAWLAAAIGFASAMAWRDAEHLQALDFLAVLLALGMAGVSLGAPRLALLAPRLRDTVWAGASQLLAIAAGPAPLLFSDEALSVPRPETQGRLRSAVRATLIALPLLLVFGALLRGADPVFASLLALPDVDVDVVVSHIVLTGFFGWVVAGWARGALLADLTRRRAPDRLPFSLEMLDVTTALGGLIVLFAAFVATQLGWFFGGEAFLQARTGLTAAEYARQGFFQMVVVVLLVVPVLLGTRAALRPGKDLERRHTVLSLPLLLLLAAMIMSGVLRMRLYVQYYGLTVERVDTLVFMGWLVIVLAWFAVTVLRGSGRPFVAGAVISGLATLALLNALSPDLIVARVNIARASEARPGARPALDLQHLASLSGEAMPLAVAAVLATPPVVDAAAATLASENRCAAARRLLHRRPSAEELTRRELDDAPWRGWNRGQRRAEQVLAANAPALLEVSRASCPARMRTPARGLVSEPTTR